MKKEVILTVRVDEDMNSAIQGLADDDERAVAWMVRKLLEEALSARGVYKTKKKK